MRWIPEWVGKNDNSVVPDRVRLRNFLSFSGRCQCGCGRLILIGEPWETDHKVALANGGQNREDNLVPVLKEHHKTKTKKDVAEKAKTYAVRKKHLGLKKPKGAPMPGTKASKWKHKMSGKWVKR